MLRQNTMSLLSGVVIKGKHINVKTAKISFIQNEFVLSVVTGKDKNNRVAPTVIHGFYNKENPNETDRIINAISSFINNVKNTFDYEKDREFTDESKEDCKETLDLLRKKL